MSTAPTTSRGVITFGKLQAKNAVRDAARVLEYPVYVSAGISKMIPNDPKMTLERALAENPDLRKQYESDPDTAKIIDSAKRLEGITRGEGVHASAVIICRDPVYDYVPTKLDTKGGMIITQYDGAMTANMGLLKMDFLGLRTLTVISKALANIKANHGISIDLDNIDMKDPAMYELFARGVAGVFQVESPGMACCSRRCARTVMTISSPSSRCTVPVLWARAWSTTLSIASWAASPSPSTTTACKPGAGGARTAPWSTKSRSCAFPSS